MAVARQREDFLANDPVHLKFDFGCLSKQKPIYVVVLELLNLVRSLLEHLLRETPDKKAHLAALASNLEPPHLEVVVNFLAVCVSVSKFAQVKKLFNLLAIGLKYQALFSQPLQAAAAEEYPQVFLLLAGSLRPNAAVLLADVWALLGGFNQLEEHFFELSFLFLLSQIRVLAPLH